MTERQAMNITMGLPFDGPGVNCVAAALLAAYREGLEDAARVAGEFLSPTGGVIAAAIREKAKGEAP